MIRHKYNATRTERDGFKFDSKAEARYYDRLVLLRQAGDVVLFLMQVPFHFPGGGKYVCDFQVFWSDGRVEFVDVKGVETESFKAKKRMVAAMYSPVEIKVVR